MANEFIARKGYIALDNSQITGSLSVTGTVTGSIFTGSFVGDGSQLTGVTGATTASYVEYSNVANKPTLVSGSSQITYSGLTGIPSGIVSGSSQISFNGIVDKPTLVSGSSQITYSGLTGIPSGIVSGSAQVLDFGIFATTGSNGFNGSQSITGSLTVTGQVVAQTLNVQQVTSSIVYSSGSNIFGNSLDNTQQFTGSVGMTGSLTVNGTSAVVGSGTANYVPKFTACNTIGNSVIQESSGNIGIGVTPTRVLQLSSSGSSAAIRLDNTVSGRPFLLTYDDSQNLTFINSSDSGYFAFNSGTGASTTKMLLTNAGNLGLGVTPSAWYVSEGYRALQVGNASLFGRNSTNSELYLSSNIFDNSSGNPTYITSDFATRYYQNDGFHAWLTAPSGTANCAISFTQAMTLNSSGNLSIGNTNDTYKLDVCGTGRFTGQVRFGTGLYIEANGDLYQPFTGQIQISGVAGNTTYPSYGFYGDTGLGMYRESADTLAFVTSGVKALTIASTGAACFACELTAKSLGTNDLILNNLNHDHANYVDGTRGSWLIQEGACDLFIINQVSCKKYKFNLIEIK